jgi:hypothetical protein
MTFNPVLAQKFEFGNKEMNKKINTSPKPEFHHTGDSTFP